jgi:hypothetical protein
MTGLLAQLIPIMIADPWPKTTALVEPGHRIAAICGWSNLPVLSQHAKNKGTKRIARAC